jgi:hypothetical protein
MASHRDYYTILFPQFAVASELYRTRKWWKKVLSGQVKITMEDFDHPPWGGTTWLEGTADNAHAKYLDRLNGWANSSAFPTWSPADLEATRNFAQYAFMQTKNSAPEYWALVAEYWSEQGTKDLKSISPDQYAKIAAAVNASNDAATTYEKNRDMGVDLPDIKDLPWWVWPIGALAVWSSIRR